ncbi:MAG: C25 family cysteine peptidase [Candidatus Thorarchaeota archaeon]
MQKISLNRRGLFLKSTAVVVTTMIVISSVAMIQVMSKADPENGADPDFAYPLFQTRPCEVSSVLAQGGNWISFDSSSPGTPAEAHVTVSDTSGITIVADFHGFWRNNYTINTILYDDLEMPGAGSMQEPGRPMLPLLFEYVEIPHDVDISIEVIASSNSTISGYNIRPAPPPNIPVGIGQSGFINATPQSTAPPSFFGSVYSRNNFFPRDSTSIKGGTSTTPLIMRGHRLMGLSFYPIQYNPVSNETLVYSQLVIKVKYSKPAQIQPVPDSLRSVAFEQILFNSLLYYDSCHFQYVQPGLPVAYSRTLPPPPPYPNTTIHQHHHSLSQQGYPNGAEYLIITTKTFEFQALRLAEWKERKGIPSAVASFESASRESVRGTIEYFYNNWYPAPTYVLLFGDVDAIPTNYDMIHTSQYFQEDYIASDLGYFNIEGHDYFPDIIYSRISVDTEEQAEIIVNKTLQYEQSPPDDPQFYRSILSAGYFEDKNPQDGIEDAEFQFIYQLERIRHYLEIEHKYNVHINYSCDGWRQTPVYFHTRLNSSDPLDLSSQRVINSLPDGYEWLWGYYRPPRFRDFAQGNITLNINEGRFFVLYNGHGGSKNMIYPYDRKYPEDDGHNGNDRDLVEGWQDPYFNTSHFSYLTNGINTPLILSIACSTGWFDGETDQDYMYLDLPSPGEENAFEDYENECFAENITRLEGGGAIAVISPSRPAPALISGDLLNGIIQAFWPGFLESGNQPIYEMGAALLSGKLHSASKWMGSITPVDVVRMTFEEFHLFGDPETKLWTDVPLRFNVSHPVSIGTTNPQKFVVTVRNNDTGKPVDFAKVCIQQDPYIYQVGYTDPNGQIIFDVDPVDTSSFLNVTVTNHNYIPYIDAIITSEPQFSSTDEVPPEVTLSEYSGLEDDPIEITVFGFDESEEVQVFFDNVSKATISVGLPPTSIPVPGGPVGYVNVIAVQGSTVATNRFYRLSTDLNPDPYIYSQFDSSTWYLAGDERVWDNPCITVYDGQNPVSKVIQNGDYDVKVTVFNRGNGDAVDTNVTLSFAPFGGGISWTKIESYLVTVDLFESVEVTFNWTPLLSDSVCLKVDLYNGNEDPKDNNNNIGLEGVNVFPVCQPGSTSFQVGNPTNNTDYVFINVKQDGNYDDVWDASIQDYSSQAMITGKDEPVSLLIDPGRALEPEEGRLFTAEIYVNGVLVGGMAFEAECKPDCLLPWLLIILFVIIAIALIVWYKRRE